jgi:hydrogenase large subunit
MPEIDIDPTTRIEGHHSATLQVEDGVITDARSKMDMFRGIESIVLGRQPSDAPQFCQMVCGVCFTNHRMASTLAIEDAAKRAGIFEGVPKQARLLRDIMEAMFLIWNDIVHLFTLTGPDYSDAIADTSFDRLNPGDGDGYTAALEKQRVLLQAFTEFGGKAPHPLTYAPGGVAATPDEETVADVRKTGKTLNEWLGPTDAIPATLEAVRDRDFDAVEYPGLGDLLSILIGASDVGAGHGGQGPGNFYANGMFTNHGPDQLFRRGIYRDGSLSVPSREELVQNITEDTAYSWYTKESGGSPSEAPPPKPEPEKPEAYTWGKAPRYNGDAMETGPLARLIVADLDPHDLRSKLGGASDRSSTLNRLIARVQELLLVRDALDDWLAALDTEGTFSAPWSDDFTADGVGLWGASRGALSHWVSVEDGEITQYQIISPTLWNLGPRDSNDKPSILEQALVGMPVDNYDDPIDVMRAIRSFDPCLGCAVHVEGDGGAFETTVEPVSPGGVTR